MPLEIGKLAKGLTGMLGLRAGGLTPRQLADQSVLTVDGTDLFLLDTRVSTGFALQAAPAAGFNFYSPFPLEVPAGEIWYVWHYILLAVTGAGEAIVAAPAVNLDGVGAGALVGDYITVAASQSIRGREQRPFWAGPGSQFGFVCTSVTGAPDVSGCAVVTKLRV